MSRKILYSFSDESQGLHKQIGCINGIFQLFDRHHGYAGKRIAGQSHKRLPPGGQHTREPNIASQKDTEMCLKKVVKEKQRTSTESSRASVSSSSCTSTFSSIDSNRASAQTEPSSSSTQFISPQSPSRDFPKKNQKPKQSLCSGQHSPCLTNVVKDSKHKEAHGLSARIATKEATAGHRMKHIDSPRPLLFKSVHQRVSNESPEVLARPKDRPRFSYDGRETREKSAIKLKELPRLSLDSRQASIRRGIEGAANKNTNQQQEPGSNKRPSSLVAKLMGLEDFPDAMSINDGQIEPIRTCRDENFQTSSGSLRTDEAKQYRVACSPRNSIQDSASLRLRNTTNARPTTPSPKFPLETAPWRQRDVTQSSQLRAFKSEESHMELNSTTVYAEIEKRLAELQFRKSGKDLRALTQILKAMQKTKEMLEAKSENHASQVSSQTVNANTSSNSTDKSPRSVNQRNPKSEPQTPPKIKGTSPPKSIVIMKRDKVTDRSNGPASSEITVGLPGLRKLQTSDSDISRKGLAEKQTAKNQSPRRNHFWDPSSRSFHPMEKATSIRSLRSTQTSKEFHDTTREKTTTSRSSGTMSPRLLQKKIGLEKHSHPTITSFEARTTRRPSNKQQLGSVSPGRQLRPKASNFQQSDDEMSEVGNDTRSFTHQGDMDSMLSSLVSKSGTADACSGQPNSTNGIFHLADQKPENMEPELNDDGKFVTPVAIQEQPSPVSVLDALFYGDDSPSPVKKISNAFQDDETLSLDETCNSSDHEYLHQTAAPIHKTLDSREHMIMTHRKLNYVDEEPSINCIEMTGKETNLDYRYIYEILSASRLLHRDLTPNSRVVQPPHPSSHTINPALFFVLEQPKASTRLSSGNSSRKISQTKLNEKSHRKLVFDAVDEIIRGKLALAGSFETWSSQRKLARRNQWGQQLLKEVCSEIDCLQANNSDSSFNREDEALKGIMWEDPAYQIDFDNEISDIVLDVERLIFKDLVVEVLRGAATSLKAQPRSPCK